MHVNLHSTVFRTYQHRIYPTLEQKNELDVRFAIEDDFFNQLISQANVWHGLGKTEAEVKHQIQSYPLETNNNADRYAAEKVRKRVSQLAAKLFCGETDKLKPRQSNRAHRNAHFAYAGVSEQHVAVPVLGTIEMEQHRMPPKGAYIFGATICSDCYGAKYYIELHVRMEPQMVEAVPLRYGRVVGLDYAQDGLYVDSVGNRAGYPAYRQRAKSKLERCKRAVSRFHTGSHRSRKFKRRLAKIRRHICNQRKDWQFKKANELAKVYDGICVENLDFAAMQRSQPALAGKMNDNVPKAFYHKLEQKMNENGKPMVKVDLYYPSSQICSACGYRVGRVPIGQRFVCPHCGTEMDRNHNAARNIREEGIRLLDQ